MDSNEKHHGNQTRVESIMMKALNSAAWSVHLFGTNQKGMSLNVILHIKKDNKYFSLNRFDFIIK